MGVCALSVCLSICKQRTLNADRFKATDFKFDVNVPRASVDMTLENFF